MKIGILTLTLQTNYGGILQAYALQTVLERMGHQIEVFNLKTLKHTMPKWRYPLSYAKRCYVKFVKRQRVHIFAERYMNKTQPIIAKNINTFINQHLHIKVLDKLEELNNLDYEALVVGSDQVWRPKYFHFPGGIKNAFLYFAKDWNIKRIAYAASFGTDEWEYSTAETAECANLIKLFDAVSVREKSGLDLCRTKLSVSAAHVLDPTMLLDKDIYTDLISKGNTHKPNGTLLSYILDTSAEKTKLINDISSEYNLVPFKANAKSDNIIDSIEDRTLPAIEQWLRSFSDAEFVVTDSFHACVFSIIFGKQFVVVGNQERGLTRIFSLLEMFGLQDRLVNNIDDIKKLSKIDFVGVHALLQSYQDKSKEFLKRNLYD